ncbi:MAG TPA: PilZ domain-containing protein [Candidatus Acidoferrum sp.]|nr:PilZ domain-containing protein [Candidatus Acidoferrum sp.]
MTKRVEITIGDSAASAANERRRNPRYCFTAETEIVHPESGTKITARTSDFSRGGCYVDMLSPLPEDTVVKLRLTKWHQTLETQARVVYSSVGMGMGLMFGVLDAAQGAIVETWLTQLRGVQPC